MKGKPKMKRTFKTKIINEFTGYLATVRTVALPKVATIKRHIRASRAYDCKSTTAIYCDGVRHAIVDRGRGLELLPVE